MSRPTILHVYFAICSLLMSSGVYSQDEQLVLTEGGLGALSLKNNPSISVEGLRKLFPEYQVKHGIYSGDSPDFHVFEVSTKDEEILFEIVSFIEDDEPHDEGKDGSVVVPIHLLKVVSPRIPDAYGIRAGDSVAYIVRVRGKNLEFGASHHDVFLGGKNIFYNIETETDESPERFALADVLRQSWPIRSISWPQAAWE